MEWFRLNAAFFSHPKHGRLGRRLGVSKDAAANLVVRLFAWVAATCETGELAKVEPEDIADGCGWEGEPSQLVAALKSSGWLDADLCVHDWKEYQGATFFNRERVKRHRRKVAECQQGNVNVTLPCRSPTYQPTNQPTARARVPSEARAPAPDAAEEARRWEEGRKSAHE